MAARLKLDFFDARRHCEAAFPDEGVCAYLKHGDSWRFVPLRNVADAAHHTDPISFPRTAHSSFVLDPLEWMAVERQALGRDVWLIHAHVDGPPVLSAWDLSTFTVDNRPLLPRLRLAVLSIRHGRCVAERRWRFARGSWKPTL